MKILVTGSEGSLGQMVIPCLLAKGQDCVQVLWGIILTRQSST
jgi:nucleoside-diphosphate-sugar epimerase